MLGVREKAEGATIEGKRKLDFCFFGTALDKGCAQGVGAHSRGRAKG